MLGGANFLTDLQAFGAEGKDLMNEETVLTRRDFLPFPNLKLRHRCDRMSVLTSLRATQVEFLFPYVDLGTEEGGEYFTPKVRLAAS